MPRQPDDFNAEIQAHIELEAARYEEQGMSREQSLATARRAFGNRTAAEERFHERTRWSWLEHIVQDVRLALRMLAKTPGWTAVAALTAALGIGSSVAIFSIVYAVLLRPLPFPNPGQLFWITEMAGQPAMAMSLAGDYFSLQDNIAKDPTHGLASIGAYERDTVSWTNESRTEQLIAGKATASFFPMLGAQPLYGRTFLPEEDRPGSDSAILLSYSFWQRHFGGDPSAVGKTISINRESKSIVGIMPRDVDIPHAADVWVPFAIDEADQRQRGRNLLGVFMVGRAAPGVDLQQVNAQLNSLLGAVKAAYPPPYKGPFLDNMKLYAEPLQERLVGNVRPSLLIFLGAVGLMLLIVCFNVSNLMLARASARQREIAVRAALGAPRRRIVALLMTESLLLSTLGGAIGLLLASASLELLSSSRQFELLRLPQISLDAAAAWFAFGLTTITGLVFGLSPALGSSAFSVRDALQQESRSATGSTGLRRARQVLVVAQVGLSLTLLIGAGLLAKTFWGLRTIDPGFRSQGLLTARVSLAGPAYRTESGQVDFWLRATEEASRFPGVQSAAVSNSIPPGLGGNSGTITIEGRPDPPRGQRPRTAWVVASDNFLPTLGVPLLKGRLLNATDRADAPRVVVINDSLRRLYFPNENPVGRRVVLGGGPLQIVGVVGDMRHFGFEQDVQPIVYTSIRQTSEPMLRTLTFVLRSSADTTSAVTKAVAAIDKDQPVFDIKTMDDRLSDSLGSRRFNAALIGAFALMAVFLAAVGVYGVMSYLVNLRLHEMGIRLALGAQPPQILSLIMKEGVTLGLIGAALGVAGAFALSRYITTMLFGVSPHDSAVFAGLTATLLAVVLASCYLPGRRAAKTDPVLALRHE